MFALSVTIKLLCLYFALKFGDTGRPSRPWILGVVLAVLFTGIDLLSGYRTPHHGLILGSLYLVSAVVLMNLYYRIQNVALSLLVGAGGAVFLLLGVPYCMMFIP